jgi:hypothetical protein
MCLGFGLIVDKELNVYFMEPDRDGDCSHSDLLERLGWKENTNKFLRNFVRVEFPDWEPLSFRFDENNTLPGWVENNRDEIMDKCNKVLRLCAPALPEYEKVRAPALAEYAKVCAPALAEYAKVCASVWAEYEKARAPALAEYKKVCDPAWAEYKKVCDPALAELINKFSKIKGYVPQKVAR